jgi:hypothetical protein
MKTFAIDTEGKITAFQSDKEAGGQGASKNRFHSIEELASPRAEPLFPGRSHRFRRRAI